VPVWLSPLPLSPLRGKQGVGVIIIINFQLSILNCQLFTPDKYQQTVIEAQEGVHLVLAPPGCGKTQILTERIRYAHQKLGVKYEDMLCLTFTNRAARGMKERIMSNITDREVEKVYVGNVHRFCSRFLFDNALISASTSVIDDDDTISIIARYLNSEETYVNANYRMRRECFDAVHLAAYMYQVEHRHPKEIRLHSETLSAEEQQEVVLPILRLCGRDFNLDNLLHFYKNPDSYRSFLRDSNADMGLVRAAEPLFRKMEMALFYSRYKEENHIIDFEDLLLLTYDALAGDLEFESKSETEGMTETEWPRFRRYPWVQVDEVQDLNPLQLKIVDLLSVDYFHNRCNCVYLGDEQQAIFSFMGAKMSTLELLKERCEGNVHKLAKNHRSPKYLLQVFNHYAYYVLNIARDMLPTSDSTPIRIGNELSLFCSNTLEGEYLDVAQQALRLSQEDFNSATAGKLEATARELETMAKELETTRERLETTGERLETTAVIVGSNADADIIGSRMTGLGGSHFKVSGTDMFSLPDVKLLLAHLSVFANEHNFIAWARILKGMKVYGQSASARWFVREMMNRALLPTDLFRASVSGASQPTDLFRASDSGAGQPTDLFRASASGASLPTDILNEKSYIATFAEYCNNPDNVLVVFDTETTGLDVLADDIVQIAAVKMRGGEVIPGSEFKVFIRTDREIPLMLGDIVNPIIEEMEQNTLYEHAEALQMFMDYVADAKLLGHNADYDYNILDANLRRYLPAINLHEKCPDYFDSLKLARLLEPDLHQYKLKHLLEVLHLEGQNSHLADADVAATCNVVKHCLKKAKEIIPLQEEFLSLKSTRANMEVLNRNYRKYFLATKERLYKRQPAGQSSLLVEELKTIYAQLKEEGYIKEIDGFKYLLRYVDKELVRVGEESTLKEQIASHILEMSTLKESDLCSADVVDERVFITTIHKAKGLEFDNVIVFDVTDDRYPSYFAKDDAQQCAEDARKLYVAMTRAKKRLIISASALKHDYHGRPVERNLSRFLNPILRFFKTVEGDEG